MAPSRDRFSPFGISLFAVAVIIIVLAAFLMMQRGGEVTGDVGADGINPAPEQLETEDVLEAAGPDSPTVEAE